jgi:hypothetical protein
VFWTFAMVIRLMMKDTLNNANVLHYASRMFHWFVNIGAAIVLGFLAGFILPLCIGITGEAIFLIPWRVQFNEVAPYPLLQCWVVGIVLLVLWIRIISFGAVADDEIILGLAVFDPPHANLQNTGAAWRRRLQLIMQNGIANINFRMILLEVIWPIFKYFGDVYFVSYFMSRSVGFLLFFSSYKTRNMLVRFSFACFVFLRILWKGILLMRVHVAKVYNEVRDSKYLIGLELTNNVRHDAKVVIISQGSTS